MANFEIFRFSVWFAQEIGELNVQKHGNMANVEETNVLQSDRFF